MAIEIDWEYVTTVSSEGHKLMLLHEGEIVDTMPVLAFMILRKMTRDRTAWAMTVVPVTSEDVHWAGQEYALVRPSGEVEVPEDQTFPSVDAFRQHLARLSDRTGAG